MRLFGEGGLDLVMGGVAFIPGGGWIVSGVYFGGKALLSYKGYDVWNWHVGAHGQILKR